MTHQATELWTAWTKRRDESAFDALVRPELPHALHFARRLGCSPADADDALQDALLRLASAKDDAPTALGVRAWLCREVHTRARSRLRSNRRRLTREAAVARPVTPESHDPSADLRDEVDHALRALDEDDRVAVELRHLHDLDYREMALVLGTTEGACRQRVQKALTRLRERFGPDAAAMVAALPLAAVRDVSSLVKGAIAKSVVTKGAPFMATTAQKAVIAAVLGTALGVTATVVVLGHSGSDGARDAEIASRDATIARLENELAEVRGRAARPRGDTRAGRDSPPVEDTAASRAPESSTGAGAEPSPMAMTGVNRPVVDPAAPIDTMQVLEKVSAWTRALKQVADESKRDAAWAEVRQALSGADRVARVAALQTVAATSDVKLDRTNLRDLVLPSTDSPDFEIRRSAWPAMNAAGMESIDFDKLHGQVIDGPEALRVEMLKHLNWARNHVIEGADADAARKLFDESENRFQVAAALQLARMPDDLAARLVDYARSAPPEEKGPLTHVLRALPDKTRGIVGYLIDRAEGGDLMAVSEFKDSVRDGDVAWAGERLRKLYDARTASDARRRVVSTLGGMRDASSREWLTSVRDDASVDESVRRSAREAIAEIERAPR